MLNGQVYVVNSPELVLAVQRHPKTVSFWFIEAKFTAILGGMSPSTSDKLLEHVEGAPGTRSLLVEGMKVTHQAMMPGKELDRMMETAVQTMASSLDRFGASNGARGIDLWSWVQNEVTITTTESVYGSMNPYRDPEVASSFWYVVSTAAHRELRATDENLCRDFADDTVMLLANTIPSVLASKGYRGRERVVNALETYFNANRHQASSILLKSRLQILEHEIAPKDIARFECVNGIAILANTVPTAFWTLYHVFSNPTILATVREQAGALLDVTQDGDRLLRTIDSSRLNEIPILFSVLQESLRYRTSGAGSRMLLEDVLLEDRYLLKKGSFLIIPSHEMHFDIDAWGETVRDFDPQRFLKPNARKIHAGAFRGFGGGANLCPGKYFAMREVVAMVAMFALRYDMVPVSGAWVEPGQDTTNMSLAIAPPKKKVVVDILPRKGGEGGSWACKT